MNTDLLATATWECASWAPGGPDSPNALRSEPVEWLAATVPGTAAGALREAGSWTWGTEDEELLDGRDWWFCSRFEAPETTGAWELRLGGLATIADLWLNGTHLLHSENMFLSHRIPIAKLEPENEIAIRFAALSPLLAQRHPRPRWKSLSVRSQSLRWYRTTMLGRLPGWSRWAAPVGPWRPIELRTIGAGPELVERRLQSRCEGAGGVVTVEALVRPAEAAPATATLRVGEEEATVELVREGREARVRGTVSLAEVERWWPHSHGDQRRYPVSLELDGQLLPLGWVGFRTLELDRTDGAFTLRVNEVPLFCRGACWAAPDLVSFTSTRDEVRACVLMAREAGMNMLRVAGYSCYEDEVFWEACDEFGVLVWQDCMFSGVDPPEDPVFVAGLDQELQQIFSGLGGHPALAVICGSSESYQQAAMLGLPNGSWRSALLEQTIPALVSVTLPGVPYVSSTPSGGEVPFFPDEGVAHYFGVGAFLRPLDDARLAGVRFAAECLGFGTPPEPETVDEVFSGARVAGHDPRWKATVTRDPGMSWDYEDVRDHYVREIFGLDPLAVRYADPEHALDLGRAAVCEAMTVVLSNWRRRDSRCAGALILSLRDLWPGAGWGLIDALGRPKAPWYAVSRAFAPKAVILTDEGLSGLRLHVFNDGPRPFLGSVRLSVFGAEGSLIEQGTEPVALGPHDALELACHRLLGGFRDLSLAYRFGPAAYDIVLAELDDEHGRSVGQAIHLPQGTRRPRLPDLGLDAVLDHDDGVWSLHVSSRLFAHYVAVDTPGLTPGDSWFHLAPGHGKTVKLGSTDSRRPPVGSVRALNATGRIRLNAGGDA